MTFNLIELKKFLADESVSHVIKVAHIAEIGRRSLDFFLYFILGYKDIDNPFHDDFIRRVEEERDKDLFLLPRGHLKSSIFTIGGSLWSIIRNPERRIGIGSDTVSRAKSFLREIKTVAEHNGTLFAYFPDIFYGDPQKQSPKWTETELQFKRRSTAKEASITAFGLESIPTGMHFEDIRLDDIVTPENTTTRDQMDKIKTAVGLLTPVLEPQGAMLRVCGTRYDYGDIYGEMQSYDRWRTYRRPALEDNEPIFPQKFSKEKLTEIRTDPTVGPYIFSCQYLLDPIDPENAMFRRQWFQYFDQWHPGPYRSYITIDLAYSTLKTADYTAMIHSKADQFKNLYVSDYIRARLTLANMIQALFNMLEPINTLDCVAVEIQPSETEVNSAVLIMIREEMKRRNKYFMLKGVKPVRDKVARANALVPLFANGMVFMRRNMPELEDELLRFPKGEHDDLVDALAYVPHVWHQAVAQKTPQPVIGDALIGY